MAFPRVFVFLRRGRLGHVVVSVFFFPLSGYRIAVGKKFGDWVDGHDVLLIPHTPIPQHTPPGGEGGWGTWGLGGWGGALGGWGIRRILCTYA